MTDKYFIVIKNLLKDRGISAKVDIENGMIKWLDKNYTCYIRPGLLFTLYIPTTNIFFSRYVIGYIPDNNPTEDLDIILNTVSDSKEFTSIYSPEMGIFEIINAIPSLSNQQHSIVIEKSGSKYIPYLYIDLFEESNGNKLLVRFNLSSEEMHIGIFEVYRYNTKPKLELRELEYMLYQTSISEFIGKHGTTDRAGQYLLRMLKEELLPIFYQYSGVDYLDEILNRTNISMLEEKFPSIKDRYGFMKAELGTDVNQCTSLYLLYKDRLLKRFRIISSIGYSNSTFPTIVTKMTSETSRIMYFLRGVRSPDDVIKFVDECLIDDSSDFNRTLEILDAKVNSETVERLTTSTRAVITKKNTLYYVDVNTREIEVVKRFVFKVSSDEVRLMVEFVVRKDKEYINIKSDQVEGINGCIVDIDKLHEFLFSFITVRYQDRMSRVLVGELNRLVEKER